MQTPSDMAARFNHLDFHDDAFVGMKVLPPQTRDDATGSIIEIQLSPHPGQSKRVLRFIGCANLRVGLDFDILADNLPPNTSGVSAHVDTHLMRELIQSQKRDWDVANGTMRSPLNDKLNDLHEFICFRVQFLGGVVEIIAREFLMESIAT